MDISADAIIWWTILAIVVVCMLVAGFFLMQAARTALTLKKRVATYQSLPVVSAVARARTDATRLETALAQIQPLTARAQIALAVLRRGPLPSDVRSGLEYVGAELRDLRELPP